MNAPAKSSAKSIRAVVGILVFFELTSGFLQMSITPLLPAVGDLHGLADSDLNWISSVQLLAAAVMVPLFGRLGDLHGHRRMLRVALAAMAVGTLLVALAPNLGVLLLGRALQGTFAALLPLEIALVRDRLPADLARRAIAWLVGSLTLGGVLGMVVMGAAHEAIGNVGASLLIPAVLAGVCVPLSFLAVPESLSRAEGRADWPGLVLLGLAMIAILAGVSRAASAGWTGAATLLPLLGGLVLLAVWVRVELRAKDALVDLREMADRRVAPFYGVAFVFGIAFFGTQTPDTTFMAADPAETGYGFGLSSMDLAAVALPAAFTSVIGAAGTAVIARRVGYRPALVASFALVALGLLGQAVAHDALWHFVVLKPLIGLGTGIALGAMPTVIVEGADPARAGIATALYNNVKTLGGAVAGGIVASVLATMALGAVPTEGAYVTVWLLCAACCVAACVLVLFARRTESADAQAPVPAH
ncbi:MFS transporter [Actinocorallia libanotica]|uniref:MFS transporter n=1 Tax=Actinocorallia libanotica TaxID=46162 RepID=A0ABN1QF01_9ACTN